MLDCNDTSRAQSNHAEEEKERRKRRGCCLTNPGDGNRSVLLGDQENGMAHAAYFAGRKVNHAIHF